MPEKIIPHASVDAIVSTYEAAEKDIRRAFDMIATAEKRVNRAFAEGDAIEISIRSRYGRGYNFDDVDDVVNELRRDCWCRLVDRLGVRRMMSISDWKSLDNELRNGKPPEINHETVRGMFRQFSSNIPSMMDRAVKEVFEMLRPQGGRCKSNSELEIGNSVILDYFVEQSWHGGYAVMYERRQHLVALENVLNFLDGNGSVNKSHRSVLQDAIERMGREITSGETELFSFRCYKNRSLHLRFKRKDLIRKLNQVAGGMRLRPAPQDVDV